MNNCIFCHIAHKKMNSWKVFENQYVYAFLDINPVSEYHTLVIPKLHYKDIFEIPESELKEIISVIKEITKLYKEKLGIENVQILNSSGKEAQQDIFHFHFHIIPRHKNDGLNIKWQIKPQLKNKFDKFLEKIQ